MTEKQRFSSRWGTMLVMLGMADPREQEDGFVGRLEALAADLPNGLFVHSAGDMSLPQLVPMNVTSQTDFVAVEVGGFVDDIPAIDDVLVTADHRVDVVAHALEHKLPAGGLAFILKDPVRTLVVPDEGMPP